MVDISRLTPVCSNTKSQLQLRKNVLQNGFRKEFNSKLWPGLAVRRDIDKRFWRFETAFQNVLGVKTSQGQEFLSVSTCQNVSATKEFKFVCSKII